MQKQDLIFSIEKKTKQIQLLEIILRSIRRKQEYNERKTETIASLEYSNFI